MPSLPRRPHGGLPSQARRPRAALLTLAASAALAVAGCGGDDSENGGEDTAEVGGPEVVAQLEERLKDNINGEVTGTPNPPNRTVEEVDCPDDVDLGAGAVREEYVCQLSGSGKTGEVGVIVIGEETFNYGGGFGGTGEFGQGITLTPPEELPDEDGQGGGGQGGGGQGGGDQSGSGGDSGGDHPRSGSGGSDGDHSGSGNGG